MNQENSSLPNAEKLLQSLSHPNPAIRDYAKIILSDRFVQEDRVFEHLTTTEIKTADDLWKVGFHFRHHPVSLRASLLLFPIFDKIFRAKGKKNSWVADFLKNCPIEILELWRAEISQWKYMGSEALRYIDLKIQTKNLTSRELWQRLINRCKENSDKYLGEFPEAEAKLLIQVLKNRSDFNEDLLWQYLSSSPPYEPDDEDIFINLFAMELGCEKNFKSIRDLVVPYHKENINGDYMGIIEAFSRTATRAECDALISSYLSSEEDQRWHFIEFFSAVWNEDFIPRWKEAIEFEDELDLATFLMSELAELPLKSNIDYLSEFAREGDFDEQFCDLREVLAQAALFLDYKIPEEKEWVAIWENNNRKMNEALDQYRDHL